MSNYLPIVSRLLRAGIWALLLLCFLVTSSPANAQTSGMISGYLTDSSGVPIYAMDTTLYVWRDYDGTANDRWMSIDTDNTNREGLYELITPGAGEYRVGFGVDMPFAPEFYNNVATVDQAQSIVVGNGQTVENINAQLEHFGKLTGRVTSLDGQPLADVLIEAKQVRYETKFDSYAVTNASGDYELYLAADQNYYVRFTHQTHTREYYNNQPSLTSANPISIPMGVVVPNFNIELEPGSVVSGRVTDNSGAVLPGMTIQILKYIDTEFGTYWDEVLHATLQSDQEGRYSIQLPSGDYRFTFMDPNGDRTNFVYPQGGGRTYIPSGTNITIDAQLTIIPTIRGHVTLHRTGQPSFAYINLWKRVEVDGVMQWQCCAAQIYTTYSSGGGYAIRNIEPGEYTVGFAGEMGYPLGEYYSNQRTIETATSLTVTPFSIFTNIDAAMDSHGYVVGTVVNEANQPLAGIEVTQYRQDNISGNPPIPASSRDLTDANGQWSFINTDTPRWYLFRDPSGQYGSEWYENKPNLQSATAITVAINATRTLLVELNLNSAPVAVADNYTLSDTLNAGTTFTVSAPGVLSNDTDANADATLTALLVSSTSQGILTFNADGSFSYTPNAGFSGTDSFQYRARDQHGIVSQPVTVSLTGNPLSSTPHVMMSLNENGNVGNFAYRDEDIILWNTNTQRWNMIFDGSDVGLGNVDVDAFSFYNGKILLSLDVDVTLGALGVVDDSDILAFTPTSLGNTTKGSFALYFDGSDVGFETAGEDIDAIGFDASGRLVISVNGALSVPRQPNGTVTANDEDLIFLNNGVFGSNTQGKWTFYFDGSDVGLTTEGEDLQALWANHAEKRLDMATFDDFFVPGLDGDENDVFVCIYGTLGLTTSCNFGGGGGWNGEAYGLTTGAIDGVQLVNVVPSAGTMAQGNEDEIDVLAMLEMIAPTFAPLLDESEPWIEAPGDDTIESPGDDLDLPDEPDNTDVDESYRLFVPSIER